MDTTQRQNLIITAASLGLMLCVTAVHYMTDIHAVAFHNVYRRLYYLPIVLAAFGYGLRGGLGVATLSSLAYLPHAFFMPHHHRDPAPDIDKLLEIALYLAVGALTGWLVERQRQVQRRLEQSLKERDVLEAQLVRAGKLSALGELTSGLAHELRNPMASILGSAEALAAEFEPTHRKHRIAQLMLSEIDRLNRVVTDLLSFARPAKPTTQPTDIKTLIQRVEQLWQHQPDHQSVVWDDALTPGQLIVEADPDQLVQVILNLVLNAAQAMQAQREPTPTVRFYTQTRELGERRACALAIEDNGPGIPPEHIAQIFDPYFTTRHEGSGLGLSISHRIMELHGGFLDVESQPQKTTFWLVFPSPHPRPTP